MGMYTRQLECLNCSHTRNFLHHTETSTRLLSQAEAIKLPRNAILTCGRCCSSCVFLSWGDGVRLCNAGACAQAAAVNRHYSCNCANAQSRDE